MRRTQILRYVLIAAAWILILAALPLRAADLNAFLNWRGTLDTSGFISFIVNRPRQVLSDFIDPRPHGGIGGGLTATPAIVTLDLLWLALVNVGLLLIAAAPALVGIQSTRWRNAIQILAFSLLALPLTLLAPKSACLPQPHEGMFIMAVAHLLVLVALEIFAKPTKATAFDIETKS
jgi:hypothetical protein